MPNDRIKKNKESLVDCNFGHSSFNLQKDTRKKSNEEARTQNRTSRRPTKPRKGVPVIFLDLGGSVVSGTSWNYAGDIICAPANLEQAKVDEILASVIEDYALYNVIVTTEKTVYDAAPAGKRIRCILTESWEWYGQAGGVAFVGSFSWLENTPCFVFTSLLNYNTKYIKEAVSHEVGHTMGLYHQASYDDNCVKISEYNYGSNGEAPIMGVGYYQPDVHWWVGPNSYGCQSIQDDNAVLTALLGLKP